MTTDAIDVGSDVSEKSIKAHGIIVVYIYTRLYTVAGRCMARRQGRDPTVFE